MGGSASEEKCEAKPTPVAQYNLSYYVKKMAHTCCNTTTAAICDETDAASATKSNAGAPNATTSKAGDTSDDTSTKANGKQSTTIAQSTQSSLFLALDEAVKAKEAADKAYKDFGCEANVQKKGCLELEQEVKTATANLQRAKEADEAGVNVAFAASSCYAFVVFAVAAAVSLL